MKRSKNVNLVICGTAALLAMGMINGCSDNRHGSYRDKNGNGKIDDDEIVTYNGGVMGIYHPITHVWIPHTSPMYQSNLGVARQYAATSQSYSSQGRNFYGGGANGGGYTGKASATSSSGVSRGGFGGYGGGASAAS